MTVAEDLCLVPAVELARRLRRRELSARELLDASLARIDGVNPRVNAIVTRDDDRARQRAGELDEQLLRSGPAGVLHGLPIAHKDLLPTAGLRTTWGSAIFADMVPTHDAVLAARVAAAGGIRIGKTNVPEFGAGSQTTNALFGSTRNPYDPALTAGGSSGGAAAALATGMVALADGSDMGGSLRNPASFCNVFGLRPTPGRVPNLPARDAWFDLSVLGPMGRCAADAALLLSAIAGPHVADPYATFADGADFAGRLDRDFAGVRVAWGGPLGLPFDQQVLDAFERARPAVEQLGVELVEAEPDIRGADEVFRVLRGWHLATTIGSVVDAAGDQMVDIVRENVAYGRTVTAAALADALQRRTVLLQRATEFFALNEFLIMPVSQVPPFEVSTPWVREIAGEPMSDYLAWMQSAYLITVLRLPAASVPAGFTPGGLPVGLQVIGRPADDLGVLQLCHALEQVFKAGDRHPDLTALSAAPR